MNANGPSDPWFRDAENGVLYGDATAELATTNGADTEMATRLSRASGQLTLTGTKVYTTGALFADKVAVTAVDDNGQPLSVVIPTTRSGVQLTDDWTGIGQRTTGTGAARFNRVAVHPSEVLTRQVTNTYEFSFLQLWLQAVIAGIVRNVVRDAVEVVCTRMRSFTHSPGDSPRTNPLTHQSLGRLASTAFAARSVVLIAAESLGRAAAAIAGHDQAEIAVACQAAAVDAAAAKVHLDATAAVAAHELFDVAGASAVSGTRNLDRHWRNIRTLSSHNPAADKAAGLGHRLVSGAPLPANGYF